MPTQQDYDELVERLHLAQAENERLQSEVLSLTNELAGFIEGEVTMQHLRAKDAEALMTMKHEVVNAHHIVRDEIREDAFRKLDHSPEGTLSILQEEVKHLRGLLKKVNPSHHLSGDIRQYTGTMERMAFTRVEAVLPTSDMLGVQVANDPARFEKMVSVIWRSNDPNKYGVVRHSLTPMWEMSLVDRREQAQMLSEEIARQTFQLLMGQP